MLAHIPNINPKYCLFLQVGTESSLTRSRTLGSCDTYSTSSAAPAKRAKVNGRAPCAPHAPRAPPAEPVAPPQPANVFTSYVQLMESGALQAIPSDGAVPLMNFFTVLVNSPAVQNNDELAGTLLTEAFTTYLSDPYVHITVDEMTAVYTNADMQTTMFAVALQAAIATYNMAAASNIVSQSIFNGVAPLVANMANYLDMMMVIHAPHMPIAFLNNYPPRPPAPVVSKSVPAPANPAVPAALVQVPGVPMAVPPINVRVSTQHDLLPMLMWNEIECMNLFL